VGTAGVLRGEFAGLGDGLGLGLGDGETPVPHAPSTIIHNARRMTGDDRVGMTVRMEVS
jgi:hypothetical protein